MLQNWTKISNKPSLLNAEVLAKVCWKILHINNFFWAGRGFGGYFFFDEHMSNMHKYMLNDITLVFFTLNTCNDVCTIIAQ